jgi:hypothetical protein
MKTKRKTAPKPYQWPELGSDPRAEASPPPESVNVWPDDERNMLLVSKNDFLAREFTHRSVEADPRGTAASILKNRKVSKKNRHPGPRSPFTALLSRCKERLLSEGKALSWPAMLYELKEALHQAEFNSGNDTQHILLAIDEAARVVRWQGRDKHEKLIVNPDPFRKIQKWISDNK